MSTKATLAYHSAEGDEPTWHLYEELFESGVVYLEIRGVDVESVTGENRSGACGGVNLVLRLPIKTASQLGLHSIAEPDRWQRASDPDKDESLRRGLERFSRLRGSIARGDSTKKPETDES
ncbi:hypothetical protein [Caballeronia concitans]|uniref:Uncharacterized protein n=1 Tax=Caballeronia concitans TaxID=1777133 RepID=A0A658R2T5_9BURK|nr:hypothetical protein [Caballeronia concitans]SAL44164.1 hypothetical protein AWB72_04660 [Caballeronia concitans]